MIEPLPLFVLANDKVLARFVMLAASLRHFKYPNKVFVVPFDDNIRVTRSIANAIGYEIYDTGLEEVNALARALYDRDPPANPYPGVLGKLNKMAFLNYPGKAVYLDSDIVVTTDPDTFNGIFTAIGTSTGRMNIGYINTSPDSVYEANEAAQPFLATSPLLCTGMMVKSEGVLPADEIRTHFTEERISEYHSIRRRTGLVDQPLWNYMVDTGLLDATDLLRDNRASRVTSPNQHGLRFTETGSLSIGGKPILLFHMAGPLLKTTQGCKFFWQGMLWEGMQLLREAGLPEWQEVLAATDVLRVAPAVRSDPSG